MERQRVMFPWDLISLAAVFLDVTQRSPKRALRDIQKNGCEGDYLGPSLGKKTYKLKSSIRTLRIDDGNDNKNGKKRNRFRLTTTLHVHHTFP